MKYVNIPNLPDKAVKLAIVDGRIRQSITGKLDSLGIEIIKTKPYPGLYNAISYHPDIMLNHLGDEYMLYAPGTDIELLDQLKAAGLCLVKGYYEPGREYPYNICYNVARVGNLAFHNLNYTDPVLRLELEKRDVKLIHVKQGYTKCAVSVVDENSIITADKGIAKIAEEHYIDVLLIEPEESIRLYELKHGFIGGSTGRISKSRWAVAGDLESLKSADRIKEFLQKRSIEVESLCDGHVIDIGTIIPISQYE